MFCGLFSSLWWRHKCTLESSNKLWYHIFEWRKPIEVYDFSAVRLFAAFILHLLHAGDRKMFIRDPFQGGFIKLLFSQKPLKVKFKSWRLNENIDCDCFWQPWTEATSWRARFLSGDKSNWLKSFSINSFWCCLKLFLLLFLLSWIINSRVRELAIESFNLLSSDDKTREGWVG